MFQSTVQQLAFVGVGKALHSILYEILKFSCNILHLKSYIESWLSHDESCDNCTNHHWIKLQYSP